MRRTSVLLSCLLPILVSAQTPPTAPTTTPDYPVFETDKLPSNLYKGRRELIKTMLGTQGAAIIFTNPERNRNNDCDFRFRADSNFLYLTGFEEPDAALILVPGGLDIDGRRVSELLFVNEADYQSETWLGYRMGSLGVPRLLGIEYAVPNRRFKEVFDSLTKIPHLALARPIVPPDPSGPMLAWENAVNAWVASNRTADVDVRGELSRMRVKKSPEEIVLMRKAASASAAGHVEALRSVRPGMREYEIQALVEYVFARLGCESVAYNSIVGSGPNSTILHYEEDRRLMQKGDIVCMDVAGEYHGYAADVTRSYPVSGKFSPEQRAIYDLVLAAQSAGIHECRPGTPFRTPHQVAAKVLGDGLIRLGIIKNANELGRYFMHGTSHFVGLDVHDAHGDNTLQDSYVLTVEPGIYIKQGSPCDKKWWNIGVRIEDDILVTADGPIILSAGAPRTADDIEATMRKGGIGNVPLAK